MKGLDLNAKRLTGRRLAQVSLCGYVLFMLGITLLIFRSRSPAHNFVPFQSILHDCLEGTWRDFLVNFLGNIVAFLPLGALYPIARGRLRSTWEPVLFCTLFSLVIEASQWVSGRRVADVDDLILNTLGGALGYWGYRLLRKSGS